MQVAQLTLAECFTRGIHCGCFPLYLGFPVFAMPSDQRPLPGQVLFSSLPVMSVLLMCSLLCPVHMRSLLVGISRPCTALPGVLLSFRSFRYMSGCSHFEGPVTTPWRRAGCPEFEDRRLKAGKGPGCAEGIST